MAPSHLKYIVYCKIWLAPLKWIFIFIALWIDYNQPFIFISSEAFTHPR